jgi:hypothetical protein
VWIPADQTAIADINDSGGAERASGKPPSVWILEINVSWIFYAAM